MNTIVFCIEYFSFRNLLYKYMNSQFFSVLLLSTNKNFNVNINLDFRFKIKE